MKLVYTGLRVKNMQQSIRFYTQGLGMKLLTKPQQFPPTKGRYAYVKSKDSPQTLELNWYPAAYVKNYRDGDQLDHLGFWLKRGESVGEKIKQLKKLGATVTIAPYVEGRTQLAFLKDPNGIWIELLARVSKRNKKRKK